MVDRIFDHSMVSSVRKALRLNQGVQNCADSSVSLDQNVCSYMTTIRSSCTIQENDAGRPVKRCEKIKEVLRRCSGRPDEVVESTKETTEEDASRGSLNQWEHNSSEFKDGHFPLGPFNRDSEGREGIFGGINEFLQDTEKMMRDVLDQFESQLFGNSGWDELRGIFRRNPPRNGQDSFPQESTRPTELSGFENEIQEA